MWRNRAQDNAVVLRELYDHTKDPLETKNLAPDPAYADTLTRLDKLPVDRNDPSWWQRYDHSFLLETHRYRILHSEVLFIFANLPQQENAIPKGPETIHLKAGVHVRDIDLKSGQKLHLDAGAFLFGSVDVWDAEDVSISGRGCIIHDGPQAAYRDQGALLERNWRPISINRSNNVEVEGVTCIARSRTWTIQAATSRQLSFKNVKIIAAHHSNVNGDGIDPESGVVFDNLRVAGKLVSRLEDIPLNLGAKTRNVTISPRDD